MTLARWRRAGKACVAVGAMVGGLLTFTVEFSAAVPAETPEPPPRFSLRWIPDPSNSNRVAVELTGVSQSTLRALQSTQGTERPWPRLLAVHVEQGNVLTDIGLPAMLGTYRVAPPVVRFEPRFPLSPGVTYRASFHPDQLPGARDDAGKTITSIFKLPPRRGAPTTVVSQAYPSADVLPENLLKFYLHFSAPMSGGHIYDHIHLRNAAGQAIELPFLEIDEELWNPAMTRLTLFIDPGRIKRGVRPLEEIGPALEEGKRYTLNIDKDWKDAEDLPLLEPFTKTFRVGPPVREPINSAQWNISAPAAGTQAALDVRFPAPMDHALALRLIQVSRGSGERVEGTATLHDQERRWSFVPARPWERGSHQLVVPATLEDLAGNNIGKSFEVDLFESVQRRVTNSIVKLGFEVK